MKIEKISKRKLESYKRAEKVAQASRAYMTAPFTATGHASMAQKEACDLWTGCVLDWMEVTGKVKYEKPKRRKRKVYG
jgi:hypothetical protein